MFKYRITFGGENINYKDNFGRVLENWCYIDEIISLAEGLKIEHIWWFFEPYVEITWVCSDESDGNALLGCIKDLLERSGIKSYKTFDNNGSWQPEWYCKSEQEREFGYRRYAELAKAARVHNNYENVISLGGCGKAAQFMRSCHVLANQLGFNYRQEGILLIKRGILALLFWFLGHKHAVWIYTKVLRQKYP